MDVLIRFGFSIEEIKNMMDTNIRIDSISQDNLNELITLLKGVGCNEKEIKNILVANPFYLNRDVGEIKKLICLLNDTKLNNLKTVFDSNPFMLNFDVLQLENIINEKRHEGYNEMEIVDYLSYEIL